MFGQQGGSDLAAIVAATTKIKALNEAINQTTDPSAKAYLQAQVQVETASLAALAAHSQAQADASANLMNGLNLFSTFSGVIGTGAPSILALFKRG